MAVEFNRIVRLGEPSLRARGMISRSVPMIRHPWRNCMVSPLLSLEVATPENNPISSKLSSDKQESTHKVGKSPSQVVF